MKLRNLMWGACACILATGCSNDDVAVENSNNVTGNNGNAYMKVRISMAGGAGSRATEGGYDYGTETEQTIKNVFFMFYDDNGNWVADGEQQENVTVDGNDSAEGTPDGNIEAIAEAVVALKLDENATFPTQVVAYVNMGDQQTTFSEKSIDDIKALTASGYGSADNGFMMTNSTYWDGGETISTAVDRSNFFETDEAAMNSNPVDIYVERLAAKVTVQNSTPTIEDIDAGNYTLVFNPEGYAVSGINTSEYYLKHLQDWTAWTWNWNNAGDHRSFWAEDPNYTTTGGLDYLTYNEATAHQMGEAQYCTENTMNATLAGNYNASTFLLLVGQYQVEDTDGDPVNLSTESDGYLYMYAGTAYMANDLKARLLNQAADNELAWVSKGENQYEQAAASAYSITRVGTTNTVTLALNPAEETTYYTRSGDAEPYTYTPIDDVDTYNENLADYLTYFGSVEAFNNGRAYFAVPIEHFGGTGEGTDVAGAVGVVRNHSYALTVTKVTGLGEGVFDPEDDIIPSDETKTYYVAATLNILSWKTVSQEVSFGN